MKKKYYYEPEFEITRFDFEALMGNNAMNSQPEDGIKVWDGDNSDDPDPVFP